jgi:hypothetical protein
VRGRYGGHDPFRFPPPTGDAAHPALNPTTADQPRPGQAGPDATIGRVPTVTREQVPAFRLRAQQLDRDAGTPADTAALHIGVQDTGPTARCGRWPDVRDRSAQSEAVRPGGLPRPVSQR